MAIHVNVTNEGMVLEVVLDQPADGGCIRRALSAISAPVCLYLDLLSRGDQHEPPTSPRQPRPELTDRQRTMLAMLAEGMTNLQIASRLGFGESTVRQDTMAIYRHLGVSGRRDVAQAAAAAGLL